MAYSEMMADGLSTSKLSKVIQKKEYKEKAKLDDSTANFEYSLMLNEDESKPKKKEQKNDNNSNVQLEEEDTDASLLAEKK